MPNLLLGVNVGVKDGKSKYLINFPLHGGLNFCIKVRRNDLCIRLYVHLQQSLYALELYLLIGKSQGPINLDYSQCLPGTATVTTTTSTTKTTTTTTVGTTTTTTSSTTTTGTATTTTTGATPTGSQIRTVQDPVYHFYLQNSGNKLSTLSSTTLHAHDHF